MGLLSVNSVLSLLLLGAASALQQFKWDSRTIEIGVHGAGIKGTARRAPDKDVRPWWERATFFNTTRQPSSWPYASLMRKEKIAPVGAEERELGPLSEKYQGYCVDESGNGAKKILHRDVSENQCWNFCESNPSRFGCAYHYDTNQCLEYVTPVVKPNSYDGFWCRLRSYQPKKDGPPYHPDICAETCPSDVVPTCSMYKKFESAGGCAQYCSDAVKAKFEAHLCGRKPMCAATCPEDVPMTCNTYKDIIKAGGCASSCPETMQLQFKQELCGFEKPDCVKTCPEDAVPSCSTYKNYIDTGGCAETCSDGVKEHFAQYICGMKPLCAAHCPEDITPTCAMVDDFTKEGGCAASCSDTLKLQFKHDVCGVTKPECTSSCPDDFVPTCSIYKTFVSAGGCAEGCEDHVKELYRPYVCGRVPLCAAHCVNDVEARHAAGGGGPTCADYDIWAGAGGCAETCSEEKKKAFKYDLCTPLGGGEPYLGHINEEHKKAYDRPPCVRTCPMNLAMPNCADAKKYIQDGACAGGCNETLKEQLLEATCDPEEEFKVCAASCEDQFKALGKMPTCENAPQYFEAGACAESCREGLKQKFIDAACNPKTNEVATTYDEDAEKPDCVKTCPTVDKPDCEEGKRMIAAGGCAANCSSEIQLKVQTHMCAETWGDPEATAAADSTYPFTFARAEAEVDKIDRVIAGAEAEAAIPDTVHTTPPSIAAEEEEDENGLSMDQKKGLAFFLVSLVCCWLAACVCFHKRLLGDTKGKGDEDTEALTAEG